MIANRRRRFRRTTWVAAVVAGLARGAVGVRAGTAYDSADHVHVARVVRNNATGEVSITLSIDSGFHINANPASLPYLIPTTLTFAGVTPTRVAYPPAILFKPKFADEAIAVYEGTIVVSAYFPSVRLSALGPVAATLRVQACTATICLPPAELSLVAAP